jgi:phenylalanine-4-hydroxylase
MKSIPNHLKRYVVEQDYSKYTNEDQAVWRFIMRHLFDFLKVHAHTSYAEGLKKTGISINKIPHIAEMDVKLSDFGWRAVPVSGFIPPAAFMSFQAHRILPIASEMRSLENILYTPAPDIIHEAAGHAPILIDEAFTNYLSAYAEVAKYAIISSEDMALYEAIRDLSDIKEKPNATDQDIEAAEAHLEKVSSSLTYVSEAQLLGRMNWWTAEYGLIGELEDPKIFGAGLLSSVGEARNCLKGPKLIEFSVDCLNFNYDITEQQPQLFVAKDFKSLTKALDEMSEQMAFKMGGEKALEKALQAKTVCTVCLNDGSTYSGVLKSFEIDGDKLTSLSFAAPCLVNSSDLKDEDSNFNFSNSTLSVTSVYGGPSSFEKYPQFEDFVAKRITKNPIENIKTEELLGKIRASRAKSSDLSLKSLKSEYFDHSADHWLAGLELLEMDSTDEGLQKHLEQIENSSEDPDVKKCIELGLLLVNQN